MQVQCVICMKRCNVWDVVTACGAHPQVQHHCSALQAVMDSYDCALHTKQNHEHGTGSPVLRKHTVVGEWKRSVGPAMANSRLAASSPLPTSALARRNASASIGPDGGTPTFQ